MEWRVVRTRCESFIFRVNAIDALISAFDNISFFLDLQRSSLNCALLLLSGVLSGVFRFVVYFRAHVIWSDNDSFTWRDIIYSRNFSFSAGQY